MGRSLYGGIVRYAESRIDADDPIDTQESRVIINNAMHFADEDGQVLVNWVGASGSYTLAYDQAVPGMMTAFGPTVRRLKSAMEFFPVRVRLHGRVGADPTASYKTWVVQGPENLARGWIADYEAGRETPNVLGTGVVSYAASTSWLDLYDWQGNASTVLYSQPGSVARSLVTLSAPNSIGGAPTGIQVCMETISIWTEVQTGAGYMSVDAFYAAEFYGP